jgi:hypothetical protein
MLASIHELGEKKYREKHFNIPNIKHLPSIKSKISEQTLHP